MRTLLEDDRGASFANRSYATQHTRPHSNKRRKVAGSSEAQDYLTSTQIMALYLARNRELATESPWSDYIATLPIDFRPWHPLTWLIPPPHAEHDDRWKSRRRLAEDCLPLGARRRLDRVKRRFDRDWRACAGLAGAENVEAFLWGWLNVNTRTLYLDLGIPSAPLSNSAHQTQEALHGEENNHTMAPILDFANHCHSLNPHACKVEMAYTVGDVPQPTYYRIKASPGRAMKAGQEVVFAYGVHSDDVLFADYGFVPHEPGPWNEVVLDDMIERELWSTMDEPAAALKKQVLEMHDYLG